MLLAIRVSCGFAVRKACQKRRYFPDSFAVNGGQSLRAPAGGPSILHLGKLIWLCLVELLCPRGPEGGL
jgi:hypothetical protein